MTKKIPDRQCKTDECGQKFRYNEKTEASNGVQHVLSTEKGDGNSIPPFFRLPRELRDKIYRHAHVNARPIGSNSSAWDHETVTTKLRPFSCQLSSAAFRACRQWHAEAAPILYGENTFGIVVRASEIRNSVVEQAVDAVRDHHFPLRLITRISIIVEVFLQEDVAMARALVAILYWALTMTTKLRRLNIDLLVGPLVNSCSRVLESLVALRKVGCVSFDRVQRKSIEQHDWPGVPANYQLYLKSFMEAEPGLVPLTLATPVLHQLFRMYRVMNEYLRGWQYENFLKQACKAMVDCDVREFMKVRKDIIDLVEPRKEKVPLWLFEHDIDPEPEVE